MSPRTFLPNLALHVAGVALAVVALGLAAPAVALVPTSADVIGEVTVEPTSDLPVDGARVTVTGTGFDTSAGIYVAVCVDNGAGAKPSPCIGGADTEGVGGATWISDNPPSYAEGLTLPYGPGGSFEVELPVPVSDDVTGVDCRVVTCAVTVRYDHLRAEDRGADHVVPVTFADPSAGGSDSDAAEGSTEADAAEEPPADAEADELDPVAEVGDEPAAPVTSDQGTSPALPIGIGAAVVLALVAGLILRRRRAAATDPPD